MKIDMSPQAITQRLKKTSELRRLCFALGGERLKQKLMSKDYNTGFIKEASEDNDNSSLTNQKKRKNHSS